MDSIDLTVFLLIGTMLIVILAVLLVIILVVTTRRQVKSQLEKQRMKLEFDEEMLHTRIEVQEQALSNFSGEIHDGIGQELSMLRLQMDRLEGHINTEKGQHMLQEQQSVLKNTIKNLRLLSHSLNTNLILQKGLEQALETEVIRLQNFTSLDCNLIIEGDYVTLNKEKELLIFRIFQESIQNVIKHAEATQISVTLCYNKEDMIISIRDNGRGFIAAESDSSTHQIGLSNMRRRAELLKGRIFFQSSIDQGTIIQLEVPNK
ncbi:MAG: hypothetical protein EOP52_08125 [Sphingobacteriales bacterium]|nr:MAG: hypothetical protein EOP52_08125 [Sphingobacteriales bacterium]